MATYAGVPTPRTWTQDDLVTASVLNIEIRNLINFMLTPLITAIRSATNQSVANATWTSVNFDLIDIDRNWGRADQLTYPSRCYARTRGYYLCSGGVAWDTNGTGRRLVRWAVNGTAVDGSRVDLLPVAGAQSAMPAASREIYLDFGDYLELQVYQDSTISLNLLNPGDETGAFMTVRWVSK